MTTRVAAVADLPALVGLEVAFAEGERWSSASWQGELDAHGHLVLVAPASGDVVAAATFQVMAETADLNRVVVAPAAQGRGHARDLLAHGLRWASQQGAERMLLEVRTDNAPALGLYRSLGFRTIAERRDYYGPGAHALVCEVDLTGAPRRRAEGEPA